MALATTLIASPCNKAMSSFISQSETDMHTRMRSLWSAIGSPLVVQRSEVQRMWLRARTRPAGPVNTALRPGFLFPSKCLRRHSHCRAALSLGKPSSTQRIAHGRFIKVAFAPLLSSPLCCFKRCFADCRVKPQYVALLPGASERRMYTDMEEPLAPPLTSLLLLLLHTAKPGLRDSRSPGRGPTRWQCAISLPAPPCCPPPLPISALQTNAMVKWTPCTRPVANNMPGSVSPLSEAFLFLLQAVSIDTVCVEDVPAVGLVVHVPLELRLEGGSPPLCLRHNLHLYERLGLLLFS
mmetsp:Transcript_16976/g.47400  ORF Transcript_16976/g.47400 Transcript_16976/m.47400 type:complete len:295 (-) Transcript_16976:592-1476(-)